MKSIAMPSLAWLLTFSSLLATAMPFNTEGGSIAGTAQPLESTVCERDSIASCMRNAGLDVPTCFASACAPAADLRTLKRQEDTCTEENLVKCAIEEWREAETCFREFCL